MTAISPFVILQRSHRERESDKGQWYSKTESGLRKKKKRKKKKEKKKEKRKNFLEGFFLETRRKKN